MPLAWISAVTLAAGLAAPPQCDSTSAESVAVVLSPRIVRPGVPGFLRGRGWRPLWGEPVRLALHQWNEIGGGISEATPEPGLIGAVLASGSDGHTYRLLPVDRDRVSLTLPPHLRGTALVRALRDLSAATYPTAPRIAAALYRAAGLRVLEPQLWVLACAPSPPAALAPLAGQPIWLERAPERDGQEWEDATRVIETDSLLGRLNRDPALRIDLTGYLGARLLDLMLGDSDRRPAHWLWGATGDGDTLWVPIASRQDAALLSAEGPGQLILSLYQPGYTALTTAPPDVGSLSIRSLDLDRPLLARLNRSTWDSVASALSERLTDSALAGALARIPPEHEAGSGAVLRRVLAARRDGLASIARSFYRLVSHYPDLELSDVSEFVTIVRDTTGSIELGVSSAGRETLRRRFTRGETEEVRLHLQGGEDTVVLRGVERSGVGVRITSTRGSVTLIREAPDTRRVVLYARPSQSRMDPRGAVRLDPEPNGRWLRWQGDDRPPRHPDWGLHLTPAAQFRVGGDLGLVLGAGAQWKWYGFGEPSYRQRLRTEMRYVANPSRLGATAFFERRDLLRNLHYSAQVDLNRLEVLRFFGYGNDTPRRSEDLSRIDGHDVTVATALAISRGPDTELKLGPVLVLRSTASSSLAGSATYGFGRFDAAGVRAQFSYLPVRPRYQPGLGAQVTVEGSFYPGWLDARRGDFGIVRAESRMAWVPGPDRRLMLAARVGAAAGIGVVPFGQAFQIGGPATLRGYPTGRFTGDRGAGWSALELRARAARVQISFVTFDLGCLVYGDAGRVWSRGERRATIHTAAGGGIWAAPALGWIAAIDALVLRFDVTRSVEGTDVSFGTGFRF